MNPFEKPSTIKFLVETLLCTLEVGDCIKAENTDSDIKVYRATVSAVSKSMGVKIKTKKDSHGELWLKRVA